MFSCQIDFHASSKTLVIVCLASCALETYMAASDVTALSAEELISRIAS